MVKFEIVEEIGIIERVEGVNAIVALPKSTACDGCSLKTCKPVGQSMTIEALNSVHAQVGQTVKISLNSNTYLKGSLIVYGIPGIALVAGAILGREFMSSVFIGQDQDSIAAISGITAYMLSFFLVKIWSNRVKRKNATKPVIWEIVKSERQKEDVPEP